MARAERRTARLEQRSEARAKRVARTAARAELKGTAYEIFIGALSVLSVANIVLFYVFRAEPAMQTVLGAMNILFSIIFLADFFYRLRTAPSGSRYFFREFGWADLLASLPFPELKILRLFRVYRVVRLFRVVGAKTIARTLVRDRANSALMTLLLMGVLVMQFGSLWILFVEEDAKGANITTAADALWYTIVTISTVGYGDHYPVTVQGQLVGTVIIIVGVGIFGTFTGYLANFFLAPHKADQPTPDEVAEAQDAAGDAAGAASGSAPGADGAAGAAAPAAATAPRGAIFPEQVGADASTAAQLRRLLAQSEATVAELRLLLAEQHGAPDHDQAAPDTAP